MSTFPERLKLLRNENRYTQREMAEILGLKSRGYQEYEYGNAYPTVPGLIQIAQFFHVSTDYLLGRDVQEPDAPQMLDITGLTPCQIKHIQFIVDDLRQNEH